MAAVLPFRVESRYVLGQVSLALFHACMAPQWNLVFSLAGIFLLVPLAIFAVGGYATAMLCSLTIAAAIVPMPSGLVGRLCQLRGHLGAHWTAAPAISEG